MIEKAILWGFTWTALTIMAATNYAATGMRPLLAADSGSSSTRGVIGEWADFTALGIVAVVLIFVVTKMLPSLHKEMAKIATAFAEATTQKAEVYATSIKETQAAHATVIEKMQSANMVAIEKMQNGFVETLDKMHTRQDGWQRASEAAIREMTRFCAARHGVPVVQREGVKEPC